MFVPSRLVFWGNETLAFRILKDGFIARVLRGLVNRKALAESKDESRSGFVVICKVEVRSRHHELMSSMVFDARRQLTAPVAPKRNSIGFRTKS